MKRTTLVAAVSLALLAQAPAAFAILVFQPPWISDPADPHWQNGAVTHQGWEFANEPTPQPLGVNPYGPPTVQFRDASYQPVTDFPGRPLTGTWHIDVTGGGFTVAIPNQPLPWDRKVVHLQYTSDKASSGPPSSTPPGTAAAGGVAGHGGDWYTYEWTIEIRPNPNFETIFVPFPESANIEEIWVHTICVPEPGTWAMFTALGLVVLGGVRILRRPGAGTSSC